MLHFPLLLIAAAAILTAPLMLDLTVEPRATAQRGGTVVLGGTVTCSADTLVTIEGQVVEPLNRSGVAVGTFSMEVPCSSPETPWRAVVTSDTGRPFKPGFVATADVSAVGFDPESGTFSGVQALSLVHLTRSER